MHAALTNRKLLLFLSLEGEEMAAFIWKSKESTEEEDSECIKAGVKRQMVLSNLEDVKIKLWECDKAGLRG